MVSGRKSLTTKLRALQEMYLKVFVTWWWVSKFTYASYLGEKRVAQKRTLAYEGVEWRKGRGKGRGDAKNNVGLLLMVTFGLL